VKIVSGAFQPATVTVTSGDTVEWTNTTAGNHQIVSDDGIFASGTLTPGKSYSFTFKDAGKYPYHDGLHPALTGSMAVNGPPPAVSLAAGLPIVKYGGSATLSGKVSSGNANEPVIITARTAGGAVQGVATELTGAAGTFSHTVSPTIETTYTATWKTASAQPVTIRVQPKVLLARLSRTRLFTKATSSISYAGHFVYLQRRASVGWVTVKRLDLGPQSGRLFKAPHVRGTRTYRIYLSIDQAGDGYMDSNSNAVRVRYRR
jgi:hypothetical protein